MLTNPALSKHRRMRASR